MHTIRSTFLCSSLLHGCGKVLKHCDGGIPIYAGVGDGDTLLQSARAFCRHLLVALVDVGLDHNADNAGLTLANLLGDGFGYKGLISVVLVGVA